VRISKRAKQHDGQRRRDQVQGAGRRGPGRVVVAAGQPLAQSVLDEYGRGGLVLECVWPPDEYDSTFRYVFRKG
jgi:hypothetical protein